MDGLHCHQCNCSHVTTEKTHRCRQVRTDPLYYLFVFLVLNCLNCFVIPVVFKTCLIYLQKKLIIYYFLNLKSILRILMICFMILKKIYIYEYKLCTRFCKVKSVSFIEILLKRLNDLKNNDVLLSSDI